MSDTSETLVSIGVPVWNGENYLREALDSIARQTYRNLEVLISDNGSADATEAIAREFVRRDSRFSYVRHAENLGASANFNYCVHNTSGSLFKWVAHDDLIEESYVEKCVGALSADPDAVMAYTHTVKIDAEGVCSDDYRQPTDPLYPVVSDRVRQMLECESIEDSILHMCFPVFGLIRRSAIAKTSLIANFPRSDNLLLFELAVLGRFVKIQEPLFLRREHDAGSVIAAEKRHKNLADIEKQLANWFDPKEGHVLPPTTTKLWLGYLNATLRLPWSEQGRLDSLLVAMRWGWKRIRNIRGEVRRVIVAKIKDSGAKRNGV